jgi:hypothetical protein
VSTIRSSVAASPIGRARSSAPIVCLTVAATLILAGCSGAPSIPATVKSSSVASIVSDVHCEPQSRSVLVTGTLTGESTAPAYSGVVATVYDAQQKQIGSADGPIIVLDDGQAVPISMTVDVTGTPASCFVTWGAGPPPPSPG